MASEATRRRAQAHAKRGYYCKCGRIVHGNGARAMHFYIGGDRYTGKREGHKEVRREEWLTTNAGQAWTARLEQQHRELDAAHRARVAEHVTEPEDTEPC